MTMESFWGVEHGEEISKQDQTDVKDRFKGGNNSGRTALFGTNANAKSDYFERGRKKGKKNDPLASTIGKSYWGVDHGEIAKSDKARRHIGTQTALGALPGWYGVGAAGGGAALTGKQDRKGRAATRAAGSTFVGQAIGGLAGAAATRRVSGALVGGSAGGATGAYLGSVRNVQRGRVKGLKAEKYPMSRSKKRS